MQLLIGVSENIPEINGAGNEGGEETNTEVPDPVASGGQSHTLSTIARREDLSLDSPNHGAPSSSKAKNEETGEDDQNDAWRRGEGRIGEVKHEMANRCKDHKADKHPDGAGNERLATAKMLNHVQTNKGDAKVDTVKDDLGNKGVDLHRLEDGGSVVEEVVGASELLQHLQSHAKSNTVSHSGSLEHCNELFDGAMLDLVFATQLALNLSDLSVNSPVIFRGTKYSADCLLSSFLITVSEIESRSFREGQDTNSEANGPKPTKTNDNTPTCRAISLMLDSSVVEASGQPNTHGDEKLVGANHGSTNPSWRCLSLVHGH